MLAPDYLGHLGGRSVDELRALRDECRAVGDDLSFLRRQVHGRLDIVRWELARRAAGEGPSSLEELIPKLDDEALQGWAAKLLELEEGYSRPRREVFQREDAVKDVLTDRLGEQPPAVPAE